jgi:hypothetical protein
MPFDVLGQRRFTPADQIRFAAISGDHNPMHMDALFARRTQAGAPVVHGIHNALTAIELAATRLAPREPVASIKAIFRKMLYVGDLAEYRMIGLTEEKCTIEAFVGEVSVASVILTFGPFRPADPYPEHHHALVSPPVEAIELTLEQIAGRTGCLAAPTSDADLHAQFPGACRLWSTERIRAMLSTTLLVGMVCPGLHSMYGGFTLHGAEPAAATLHYRVDATNAQLGSVRLQVQGSGVFGRIESFFRTPPVQQPSLTELAGACQPDEFAGSTALVIGGSRGLGELTAKLLAAGGARVIITYAHGQADAERVADEIRGNGSDCDVAHFDFRADCAGQLTDLPACIGQLYYFATPPIFRRKAGLFDSSLHHEFEDCYVTKFYQLFSRFCAASAKGLAAFYPSSVAVEERPRDMTEYAMAKAAGEILCADLNAFLPKARILVSRLPRLPTDQTTSLTTVAMPDPVAVMLPLIRQVQV